MKELYSIRNRERTYRIIILGILLFSAILIVVSLVYSYTTIQESKNEIYVLMNSRDLIKAKSLDGTNSYDIITQSQIEHLNKLVYQHVPDPKNINKRISEAYSMSDKSVTNLVDGLKQAGFYNNLVAQNFYTLLLTDSISVNYSVSPYKFQYYGKLKIARNNQIKYKNIITSGQIENMGMITEKNTRGYIVRNFRLIDDSDVR